MVAIAISGIAGMLATNIAAPDVVTHNVS